MIYTLVYTSTEVRPLSRTDLTDLLVSCRHDNQQRGVTGMLLYRGGTFLQLLEGDQGVVRTLYAEIAADPRHRDVQTVWVSVARERRFPDWTMGFRDLDDEPIAAPGFSDVLRTPSDIASLRDRPQHVQDLLDTLAT